MSAEVTKPQAVIRPLTTNVKSEQLHDQSYKTASGNQAFNVGVTRMGKAKMHVTKPQAVIRPLTLWLAHGSQSGLKALQWKIKKLFIAKTAKLLTRAVFLRLR